MMSQPKQYKLLIIEDDEVCRYLTEMDLKAFSNIEYQFKYNAEDALEQLDALDSTNSFDCILIDINLPGMNGFNFVETFKKRLFHQKFKSTKLMIISTSNFKKDKETSKNEPLIIDHFEKPFSDKTITAILRQI